ncbi:flagellar basal body-associated protein FliL [Fictibacillus macauensis ZFHKF-1]|uniref:Flagellar protein FliL n=1 Tax=Fictibacillus macauensis ZFHKF-1 TaxID=1196324 RepID=I8UDV4_9BACL|nr:flagellar basal body-associated FliL family protein [Fictibacillus macauensis]EIT85090.1 flagellar basal body-associated protein FliL [Fictibacillus macauensis ZFHKF-1]
MSAESMPPKKRNGLFIVVIAVLIASGAMLYFLFFNEKEKAYGSDPGAEDLAQLTVETKEIITNLKDQSYIKTKFRFQTDTAEAKEELEQRLFQVNHLVIYELAAFNRKELQGQQGISKLEERLKRQTAQLLQKGSIQKVYTVEKVVQ